MRGKQMARLLLLGLLLFQAEVWVSSLHTQECPVAMDIAFMLDASGSVLVSEFDAMKTIIKKFTPHFTISSTGTHVALMYFADAAIVKHFLKEKQSPKSVHRAVDTLAHPGGGTNMVLAFREAHRLFSPAEGGREHLPRVLVIATDGHGSNRDPESAIRSSKLLKDDGIVIISLGTGTNINRAQLDAISSSNGHVVMFSKVSSPAIERVATEIAKMACAAIRKPEVIISRADKQSSLRGHVITTLQAWDELSCAFNCLNNRECFSFNFKKISQVCELNHSNKLTSPTDFIAELDSMYYEMAFS